VASQIDGESGRASRMQQQGVGGWYSVVLYGIVSRTVRSHYEIKYRTSTALYVQVGFLGGRFAPPPDPY
jgi:hypothetical protein